MSLWFDVKFPHIPRTGIFIYLLIHTDLPQASILLENEHILLYFGPGDHIQVNDLDTVQFSYEHINDAPLCGLLLVMFL